MSQQYRCGLCSEYMNTAGRCPNDWQHQIAMSEQPKTERCQESLQRQPDGSLLCPSCGWVVEAYPTKAARSIPSGAELPVLTVLRELVALKDLKDSWRARSDTGETPNEQDFDYYKRKPLAWEAARALLADPSRGERD